MKLKQTLVRRRIEWSLALALMPGVCAADAPITAGPTIFPSRAIQDVVLFANTTVNPGDTDIVIDDLFGDSIFGFNRETQVGTTIGFDSLIGAEYLGSLAGVGDYQFGIAGDLTGADYSGQISNVTQDGSDSGLPSSFVSGDFFFTGDQFAFEFLSGPLAGVVLVTDPAQDFSFVASFDGLPPSPGTVLTASGDQVLDVLFIVDDGTGNLITEVVGQSSDRRVVVTPEPTGAALLAVSAFGVGLLTGRRKLLPRRRRAPR